MDPLIIYVIASTAVTIAAIIVTAIMSHSKHSIMHQRLTDRTHELFENHILSLRKQHENISNITSVPTFI